MSTDQHARNVLVLVYISWTVYTKANYPYLAAPTAGPLRVVSAPKGQWRDTNRCRQIQTAIHSGVMPAPPPAHDGHKVPQASELFFGGFRESANRPSLYCMVKRQRHHFRKHFLPQNPSTSAQERKEEGREGALEGVDWFPSTRTGLLGYPHGGPNTCCLGWVVGGAAGEELRLRQGGLSSGVCDGHTHLSSISSSAPPHSSHSSIPHPPPPFPSLL